MPRRLCWAAILVVLAAGGCDDDESAAGLFVDLKTDLVPVTELVGVRTEVQSERFVAGVPSGRRIEQVVTGGQEFLEGVRIASFKDLAEGTLFVRVAALGPGGEVVVERVTSVRLRGRVVLTVLLTRDCRGIICPPEGAPELEACLGGRCVDPSCSPENPAACGDPVCDDARPCPSGVTCVQAACVGGACLADPDDGRCPPEERCDVDRGCVRRDGTDPDAGLCEETETRCTDGIDDDCDEQVDCADPECDAQPCGEFGVTCTAGACGCPAGMAESTCDDGMDGDCDGLIDCADPECDDVACGANGVVCIAEACACPGAAPETECDDGQDDDCDGATDCADTDCDTRPCGGTGQTCAMGMCSCPGGAGVETLCGNAADDDCDGEADCADTDCETQVCGMVVTGAYGACGGFSGTCDEGGTQSRSVTTPTCGGGACADVVTMEMQSCLRDTDGDTCGTRTVGAWGSCGGFSNACDESGTQSRTITDRECRTGSCTSQMSTERRGCSRSVADGTACGGGNRCCGTSCVSMSSNGNCGSCGIGCGSLTCASTGTGGHACRGCSSNAQCRSIYGPAATCYNVAAPPAFCQCQDNGDCPGSALCAEPSGHNYCHY